MIKLAKQQQIQKKCWRQLHNKYWQLIFFTQISKRTKTCSWNDFLIIFAAMEKWIFETTDDCTYRQRWMQFLRTSNRNTRRRNRRAWSAPGTTVGSGHSSWQIHQSERAAETGRRSPENTAAGKSVAADSLGWLCTDTVQWRSRPRTLCCLRLDRNPAGCWWVARQRPLRMGRRRMKRMRMGWRMRMKRMRGGLCGVCCTVHIKFHVFWTTSHCLLFLKPTSSKLLYYEHIVSTIDARVVGSHVFCNCEWFKRVDNRERPFWTNSALRLRLWSSTVHSRGP